MHWSWWTLPIQIIETAGNFLETILVKKERNTPSKATYVQTRHARESSSSTGNRLREDIAQG